MRESNCWCFKNANHVVQLDTDRALCLSLAPADGLPLLQWGRERKKGRERWGLDERRQHVHQRATYRTLDSQHAALVPFSSFLSLPPPFLTTLSICSFIFPASSFLLQFSRLLFLRCMPKMTPLILRSRSRQPPDQAQQLIKELCQWASKARTFPF